MPPLPKLHERNHVPEDPAEYSATFEHGTNETKEIDWSIHPCTDAAVIAPRPCQFGDLPTLSDDWNELNGNKDPQAFMREIITADIVEL